MGVKTHDDAETNLRIGVWAVCRRVSLVAGSVAVVVGALGADSVSAAGTLGASEEGRVVEKQVRTDTPVSLRGMDPVVRVNPPRGCRRRCG